MPGGQAIASATGILFKDATNDVFVALRSRKSGTGTASQIVAGQGSGVALGTVIYDEAFLLSGSVMTVALGTLTYFGRATLTWNANSEPDILGYRLWRGTSPTIVSEIINVGNVTTYQVGELLPGFTHYFVVTAYDTWGLESSYSAQVSKVF